MQAKAKKIGDVVVVYMRGIIDLDSQAAFHETCMKYLVNEKVVFCLKDLNFVGSNGITVFVNTLNEFLKHSLYGLRVFNVGVEFLRIFEANVRSFQLFENESLAAVSFDIPSVFQESSVAVPLNESSIIGVGADIQETLESSIHSDGIEVI